MLQPVPPGLEYVLEFELRDKPLILYSGGPTVSTHRVSVVGPHTQSNALVNFRGHTHSFAVFFTPLGFSRLFRSPAAELVDAFCDGAAILGRSIATLLQKLAECRSFSERVTEFERFISPYASRPCGETSIARAANNLFRAKGMLRIQTLAVDAGLSPRQFERRFASLVGMSPKLFARICRFQMALDRKVTEPELSWLYISHEFGYHDQNHMIRDFQLLCGKSPSSLLSQLGDMRPPALAGALQQVR